MEVECTVPVCLSKAYLLMITFFITHGSMAALVQEVQEGWHRPTAMTLPWVILATFHMTLSAMAQKSEVRTNVIEKNVSRSFKCHKHNMNFKRTVRSIKIKLWRIFLPIYRMLFSLEQRFLTHPFPLSSQSNDSFIHDST